MAAATSAVAMAMPLKKALFKPLPMMSPSRVGSVSAPARSVKVSASLKEKAMAGFSAGVMSASVLVPQVAEAAEGGLSPSLKNFLLSIVAGGVVLTAIIGVVVGVSNFDPVKRT